MHVVSRQANRQCWAGEREAGGQAVVGNVASGPSEVPHAQGMSLSQPKIEDPTLQENSASSASEWSSRMSVFGQEPSLPPNLPYAATFAPS